MTFVLTAFDCYINKELLSLCSQNLIPGQKIRNLKPRNLKRLLRAGQ